MHLTSEKNDKLKKIHFSYINTNNVEGNFPGTLMFSPSHISIERSAQLKDSTLHE